MQLAPKARVDLREALLAVHTETMLVKVERMAASKQERRRARRYMRLFNVWTLPIGVAECNVHSNSIDCCNRPAGRLSNRLGVACFALYNLHNFELFKTNQEELSGTLPRIALGQIATSSVRSGDDKNLKLSASLQRCPRALTSEGFSSGLKSFMHSLSLN